MKHQKISRYEKIKIFLHEYYLGYGVLFSLLRMLGGPLIVIMGLSQYHNSTTKPSVGYAGFMILFGIYYILKPLFILLTQKAWFQNLDIDYTLEPEKIILQAAHSKSEIAYSDLKSVLKRKSYYALKTHTKQGIYLPLKYLTPTEVELLNQHLK